MIDQRYAEKFSLPIKYGRKGDAVRITAKGKVIILGLDAYVMNGDGSMMSVTSIIVGTPLTNVGRVTKMEIVGDRYLCYVEERKTYNVNGFVVGIWKREVLS